MDFFNDYTLRLVAVGSAVLGATSGVLGPFAYLRRQSLLGDAVSHAALPGIALAFLLTGSKAPLVLMVVAGVAGWNGTLVVRMVVGRSSLHFSPAFSYGRRCTTPSWVFSHRGARRTVKYDSAPLKSKTQLGAAPRRPRHESR